MCKNTGDETILAVFLSIRRRREDCVLQVAVQRSNDSPDSRRLTNGTAADSTIFSSTRQPRKRLRRIAFDDEMCFGRLRSRESNVSSFHSRTKPSVSRTVWPAQTAIGWPEFDTRTWLVQSRWFSAVFVGPFSFLPTECCRWIKTFFSK